jgi:hypothetical protein
MPIHNVHISLPWRELGNSDVVFTVYQDGEKLGTITVSKGAIEWYPSKAKNPYKMDWGRFDKILRDYFNR